MATSPEIHFVDDRPIDRVLVAIVPIDSFTGQIVNGGVSARIEEKRHEEEEDGYRLLPDRPVRNRSGMLVFIHRLIDPEHANQKRLPQERGRTYRIKLTATAAGYFDPEPVNFTPDVDEPNKAENRREVVFLYRRPAATLDLESTIVAGVFKRDEKPISGGRIWTELDFTVKQPDIREFVTESDDSGAFALPLRLPYPAPDDAFLTTVTFKFKETKPKASEEEDEEKKIEPDHEFTRKVRDGRTYRFKEAVDLKEKNEPKLVPDEKEPQGGAGP